MNMVVKGRPLGIWIICAALLAGALAICSLSAASDRFVLVSTISFAVSGLFVIGLLFRVTWLYFAFLLSLSFAVFLQLVAILLILSALVAGGGVDWLQLIGRYWQGAVVMMIVCGTIFYLSRFQVREYFFPK